MELQQTPPKVPRAGKQRTRYQPTGQRPERKTWIDKRAERRAAEAAASPPAE